MNADGKEPPLLVQVRADTLKEWLAIIDAAIDVDVKYNPEDPVKMLQQAYEKRGWSLQKIRNQITAYTYNLP